MISGMVRRGAGLLWVAGGAVVVCVALGCSSASRAPGTVASGHGGGGGGATGYLEGGSPDALPAGTVDSGWATSVATSCVYSALSECLFAPNVNECAGTPSIGCPSDGLVGCCAIVLDGDAVEACFYGKSSIDYSDITGCSASGGTWSVSQSSYP
jgi:hypothetical protein